MAEALAIIGGRRNLIAVVATTSSYKSLKEEQLLAIEEYVLGSSYQRARDCNLGKRAVLGQLVASHRSIGWNV